MPATYEPIATTTLSSAAVFIEFSSISSAYTDLRIVTVGKTNAGTSYVLQFNGDTATNYSRTQVGADGSLAYSLRTSNTANANLGFTSIVQPVLATFDIFNYAGSTYKTTLATNSQDENGAGYTTRTVMLWRSTSAITSVKIIAFNANFTSGTTATLYGILKA